VIAITDGGLATSSTSARRWAHAGSVKHHILDPRSLDPVTSPWRAVSVAAADCLTANITSTTAIIRGQDAPGWLRRRGTPARLVGHDDRVVTLNGWPEPDVERVNGVRSIVG
jgi:thiamine biosynthesis lipoprotein